MSAASFAQSSYLQAVNVYVMLWPVHVQIFPQASKQLCPAKLQTRDAVSTVLASLSARSFPLTPAWPGKEIHNCLCSEDCAWLCTSPSEIPPFAVGSLSL